MQKNKKNNCVVVELLPHFIHSGIQPDSCTLIGNLSLVRPASIPEWLVVIRSVIGHPYLLFIDPKHIAVSHSSLYPLPLSCHCASSVVTLEVGGVASHKLLLGLLVAPSNSILTLHCNQIKKKEEIFQTIKSKKSARQNTHTHRQSSL